AGLLVVLPCSGRKNGGGTAGAVGPSVLEFLPSGLAERLQHARSRLSGAAQLDEALLLPARHRYSGSLYRASSRALDSTADTAVLILSGAYGLVLAEELIGMYDRRFVITD